MKQTKTIKLLKALTILSLQMTYVLIGQTCQNTYELDFSTSNLDCKRNNT